MGCNTSKLDDEEVVQICKDRKKFIKQALEHRTKFASGHIAYIQSLKRISAALREYIEVDEPREFSFITPPFTPVKKLNPKLITISPKCFSAPAIQSGENSNVKINYYRPSGTESVSVEERPQSPDTYHVQSYSPMHQYGFDGFFTMQSPQRNSSYDSHSYSSVYNRPDIPPPSPQNPSPWDFFWNPFSSLDYYGYPMRSSLEQSIVDDDIAGLRQVREEEGIPDLEEETEHEEIDERRHEREDIPKEQSHDVREEITVEDVDEEEEDDETETDDGNQLEGNGMQKHVHNSIASSHVPNAGHIEVNLHETTVSEREKKQGEAPGFTVYVNRRPTSMDEVIKDLESQFMIVCAAANEISAMLEANRADRLPASSEVTAMKMLNPVALFRSASSRSSSSRFLVNSLEGSIDEGSESSSYLSDGSCMFSGSHHSTLDRLYAWEKRLYEEVRSGERVRLAYEKKCTQLQNQESKGDDPSTLEKTKATLRDLHTQIKVSIHSIEAISKRIETLRDEELHPQLLELVQGLARMWKVMAECHQMQKHTLDEAKLLLAGTPSKLNSSKRHQATLSTTDPHRLARSSQILETELRNWRACFTSWIASQQSYIHALSSWLLRCMRREPKTSELPFSPRRSPGVHPIFGICIHWTRLLDAVCDTAVLDGMDFFAAGMGSIYAQSQAQAQAQAQAQSQTQIIGGSRRHENTDGSMEMVEVGKVEEVMTPEKMAEVAVKVLCAGMSVAMSSLAEFAVSSAEGYAELVKQWENVKCPPSPKSEGM
ncbi:nitrate regulatory gene2 protein-like [Amaranthus tricolor]|uniref:nitrate regulatory gene2 protein-like n=1 Tax=Amaranthus tricolor TaxID=29722 RepID=UPI00258788C7|nr:nitrate regulatory gene2 protein-like [Amaranthus tricolor]